jgi:dTDP-4-dehydrorhamnose reductase
MLLIVGLGYTSAAFAARMATRLGPVVGTSRNGRAGTVLFDGTMSMALEAVLPRVSTLLCSAPPSTEGDPFLNALGTRALPHLRQALYLSTIGVYGNQAGAWINENAALNAKAERALSRIKAEEQWLRFGADRGVSSQIFRLGGIYGPGRNPLVDLSLGTAKRIEKPGQMFNRIHVADIAVVLEAALARGQAGTIYNVVDDEPAAPQDVVEYACALAGAPVPPVTPFATAEMSSMARAFYQDNRRVSNRLVRHGLKVALQYPTYREGLHALHKAGEYSQAAASLRARDLVRR